MLKRRLQHFTLGMMGGALLLGATGCSRAQYCKLDRTALHEEQMSHHATITRLQVAEDKMKKVLVDLRKGGTDYERAIEEERQQVEIHQNELNEREQRLADTALVGVKLEKERDSASELADQLHVELKRTSRHLQAIGEEKQQLAQLVDSLEVRLQELTYQSAKWEDTAQALGAFADLANRHEVTGVSRVGLEGAGLVVELDGKVLAKPFRAAAAGSSPPPELEAAVKVTTTPTPTVENAEVVRGQWLARLVEVLHANNAWYVTFVVPQSDERKLRKTVVDARRLLERMVQATLEEGISDERVRKTGSSELERFRVPSNILMRLTRRQN